jgi:hypothetical protein
MKWTPLLLMFVAFGCTTRPAWEDDRRAAEVSYWLDQAATERVVGDDYEELWQAADDARRRFGFEVALADFAGGVLATTPLVGGQWFEPWRDEQRTPAAWAEASLATVRRHVVFTFKQQSPGEFAVVPKVVVERQARGERPISFGTDFRGVLGTAGVGRRSDDDQNPRLGWFAQGRDPVLEAALARYIAAKSGGERVTLVAD